MKKIEKIPKIEVNWLKLDMTYTLKSLTNKINEIIESLTPEKEEELWNLEDELDIPYKDRFNRVKVTCEPEVSIKGDWEKRVVNIIHEWEKKTPNKFDNSTLNELFDYIKFLIAQSLQSERDRIREMFGKLQTKTWYEKGDMYHVVSLKEVLKLINNPTEK